jgi:hypothetical protein
MDKEQARFILRSFRPDGADAEDPDFAEALRVATENRELGEWLASERAFDAEFARALGTVDLPENLREDIIACLAAERGDFPQAEDATDAAWIGAFASIQPPASLRDEVLAAMDRTATRDIGTAAATTVIRPPISVFRRLAIPLAAAAGIALAFLITRPAQTTTNTTVERKARTVPIEAVQAGFVRTFESPVFDLEQKHENQQMLLDHLKERKLPCPSRMPRGLQYVKGLGCRELMVDGKRGSLVCFKTEESGIVHMVIFDRDDVSGDFPAKANPVFTQCGDWASARWADGDKVFLIMSHAEVGKLTTLF